MDILKCLFYRSWRLAPVETPVPIKTLKLSIRDRWAVVWWVPARRFRLIAAFRQAGFLKVYLPAAPINNMCISVKNN